MNLLQAFDAPTASPLPSAPVPAPTAAAPVPAAPVGPPPAITANRRRLDPRFPVLAFSVRTQGRPWFEVLLTTDRTLFDPANAARRTPANFYAGRQDGGLARATAEETAYVVPAAVLRRFAGALPRPAEIFFTVAAYEKADGPPILAQPVAILATTAPSVALSRDFEAQTLAVVLGIPADKLQPVDAATPPGAGATPVPGMPADDVTGTAQSWSSEDDEALALEQASAAWFEDPHALALDDATAYDAPEPDPGYDAMAAIDGAAGWATGAFEGEPSEYGSVEAQSLDGPAYGAEQGGVAYGTENDGVAYGAGSGAAYGAGSGAAYGADDPGTAYGVGSGAAYGADDPGAAYGFEDADAYGYEDPAAAYAYDDEPSANGGPVAALAEDEAPEAEASAFDYDDGYDAPAAAAEDWAEAAESSWPAAEDWTEAAESSWPAGSAEPEQLADADDQRLEDELAMQASDLEPYDESQGYAGGHSYADTPPHPADSNGYAEELGYAFDADEEVPDAVATALEAPLDIPGKIAIVTKLGRLFESSAAFAGINADTEFSNPNLPQYRRWHVGLSYGLIQFTQDSGGLGQLLRMMRDRDPARFREVFGPDSEALVEVTNRPGPSGRRVPGGRSVRVQPVAGADLWTEPWVSRFRAAAAHPPFQAAQNELAVRRHVDPMLAFAAGFGLTTERALAMVVDRAIQMGVGGARRWITEAIGPVRTDAQRQQALGALGQPDLAAFQRAAGVRRDGDFGPLTHAAMVGALRRLGPASPVPIPTRDQMLDAIVARADGSGAFWRRRPRTIRTSTEFADAQLTWPAATAAP